MLMYALRPGDRRRGREAVLQRHAPPARRPGMHRRRTVPHLPRLLARLRRVLQQCPDPGELPRGHRRVCDDPARRIRCGRRVLPRRSRSTSTTSISASSCTTPAIATCSPRMRSCLHFESSSRVAKVTLDELVFLQARWDSAAAPRPLLQPAVHAGKPRLRGADVPPERQVRRSSHRPATADANAQPSMRRSRRYGPITFHMVRHVRDSDHGFELLDRGVSPRELREVEVALARRSRPSTPPGR